MFCTFLTNFCVGTSNKKSAIFLVPFLIHIILNEDSQIIDSWGLGGMLIIYGKIYQVRSILNLHFHPGVPLLSQLIVPTNKPIPYQLIHSIHFVNSFEEFLSEISFLNRVFK